MELGKTLIIRDVNYGLGLTPDQPPIFIIPRTKFVSKKDYHLYQCIKQEINIPSGEQEQGGMPIIVGWLK